MKNRIYISIILIAFSVSSCEDFLTIQPEGDILTEDAINTPDDLQRFLVSGYDVMRNGGYLGGDLMICSDLVSDNAVKDFSDFSWDQVAQRSMNLFNERGRNMWREGYRSADRANFVLENLDVVADLSASDRDKMTGEALFIRAVAHFELVRFFALPYDEASDNPQPGVPIRIVSSSTIEKAADMVPRSSVADVYTQIITDLTDAIDLLPATNNGYATSWAAKGYLAKVYFQMNDFDNAFLVADDIIQNGGFSLNTNVMDRFATRNSSEAIFELQSPSSGSNSAGSLIGMYRQDGPGNPGMHPSQDLLIAAISDTTDSRATTFYNTRFISGSSGPERTYCSKFDYDFMNVPLVHLNEIILIRAESAVEKTVANLALAIDDLNLIRDRAFGEDNNPVSPSSTEAELVQIARHERRLELAFEGNRLHDLKRTKSDVRGLAWNSNYLVWQIPDEEQAGNPDIELNPTGDK